MDSLPAPVAALVRIMPPWLRELFLTPSAFPDDPRKYARNQVLHFALVGALPVALIGPWFAPISLTLYAGWEWLQWRYLGGDLSDGLEDMAFQSAGVILCVTLFWPMLVPMGLILGAGVALRRGL
ncbi:hypothetical protein [Rhodovulum strictum]|uniref:Uncharacterized protein n=1 Tax=Rhodovulum strictum TaxID=58314 RepID=A0A844BBK3_9RHOB|nr:hypothetical protein [Rhodovulum strictum]MRH22960.1 hypothetical protein [Rhodovulum strictum]